MKVKKVRLTNGLRVILIPMEGSELTFLRVFFKGGSRTETEYNAGISHFLEHMFISGGMPPHINEIFDAFSEGEAETSDQTISFSIKCCGERVEEMLQVLSYMFFKTKFNKKNLDKEKKQILREKDENDGDMIKSIQNNWRRIFLGDQPINRDPIGTRQNIIRFTSRELRECQRKILVSRNIVIVVAGFVPHNVIELIEKFFSFRKGYFPKKLWTPFKKELIGRDFISIHYGESVHIVFGGLIPGMRSKKKIAVDVFISMLCEGINSRFRVSTEGKGLVYATDTTTERFDNIGWFFFDTSTTIRNLRRVVRNIVLQCRDIYENGATEEEVEWAKKRVMTGYKFSFKDPKELSEYLGETELLYGKMPILKKIVEATEKVTHEQINRLAKEILAPSNLKLAVVGPIKNKKKLRDFYKELLDY